MLFLVWFINIGVDSAMSAVMMNVLDTWMQELVGILVYHRLQKSKLSLGLPK